MIWGGPGVPLDATSSDNISEKAKVWGLWADYPLTGQLLENDYNSEAIRSTNRTALLLICTDDQNPKIWSLKIETSPPKNHWLVVYLPLWTIYEY